MTASPNAGRRGYSWRKLRAQVLTEEPQCHWCSAPSDTVDHRIPISKGGAPMDRSNLVGSCTPCNLSKGNRARPKPRQPRPKAKATTPQELTRSCLIHGASCKSFHSRTW